MRKRNEIEKDKVEQFLIDNKVSFNQLIKSFNFWESLSFAERNKFINDGYNKGKYNNIGWY